METSTHFSSNKFSIVKFTTTKTDTNCSFKSMSKSKRMLISTRRNEHTRSPTILTNESSCNRLQIKSLSSFPNPMSEIIPDFRVIEEFFQCEFQSKLLYRASNHNFSVKAFHQICDDIPNTLVLCKTNHSQIIGGFTPLTWKPDYEKSKTFFKSDHTQETFLLSVTNRQKYPIRDSNRNKAICCFQKFGPTFGGGYDLCIGDYADIDSSSFSFFPCNFKINRKIQQNQRTNFIGTAHDNFKVKEWQVFELKFNEKKSRKKLIRDWRDIKIEDLKEQKKIKKVKKPSHLKNLLKNLVKYFLQ